MKTLLLSLLLAGLLSCAQAQPDRRFGGTVSLGTAIALSEPARTPFTGRIAGYYNLGGRLAVGAGTGLAVYEKVLVPVFGEVRFLLTRPRRFTPYLSCGAGYAFAPAKDANGGFCLYPCIGVRYARSGNGTWFFAVGYERQALERLKRYRNDLFTAEFVERLRHHAVSFTLGFGF